MARRGFAIIFTFLGAAFAVSIAGFITLYLLVGREPAVPTNSVLTLKIGGDLAEMAPGDVVSYLSGSRPPTVRAIVENLRKAKVDRAGRRGAPQAFGIHHPLLGQDPGAPRRRARLPPVGQTALRLSRIRRRSRLLPRQRRRQGIPDAVEPPGPHRRRHLSAVSEGNARQGRCLSGPPSRRTVQDRRQHLHRKGIHARAQGDGRCA